MDYAEFEKEVDRGTLTFAGISQYIAQHVSTKEERDQLHAVGIFSPVEILEGTYTNEQAPTVNRIVKEWNKRLGFPCI